MPLRETLLEKLRAVLDPELDESILEQGFVEAIEVRGGTVTVRLRLPTRWCAPNFVYIMAEDVRRQLLQAGGVREVTVRLQDHLEVEAIEAGVNAGLPFHEAFPGKAFTDLAELRGVYLRKGFARRQEQLLQALAEAGLSLDEIAALKVGDAKAKGGTCRIELPGNAASHTIPARSLLRYLERRADLGLDCSPHAPLITDLDDRPVPAARLAAHWKEARTVRVAMEASGALCSALLEERTRTRDSALIQIGGSHVSAG